MKEIILNEVACLQFSQKLFYLLTAGSMWTLKDDHICLGKLVIFHRIRLQVL